MQTAAHNMFRKLAFAFAPTRSAAQGPTGRTTVNGPVVLAKRGLLKIDKSLGRRICCDSGLVWITLGGDYRDIFLEAGQVFVSDRNTKMVILAVKPATIRIG
jgi:Protein of unknown function (DUF2917)